MPAATCPSGEDLKAYAWGELPLQHEDELADHLEACPRCENVVQTLERQGDPLLARLRLPVANNPFQEEPERRQVIQRLLAEATLTGDRAGKGGAGKGGPEKVTGRKR